MWSGVSASVLLRASYFKFPHVFWGPGDLISSLASAAVHVVFFICSERPLSSWLCRLLDELHCRNVRRKQHRQVKFWMTLFMHFIVTCLALHIPQVVTKLIICLSLPIDVPFLPNGIHVLRKLIAWNSPFSTKHVNHDVHLVACVKELHTLNWIKRLPVGRLRISFKICYVAQLIGISTFIWANNRPF